LEECLEFVDASALDWNSYLVLVETIKKYTRIVNCQNKSKLLDLLVAHNRNILKISKHRGCQCTKNALRFGHDLHKAALVQWPSKLRGERQDAVDHLVCLVWFVWFQASLNTAGYRQNMSE
jgi:hypothetical protein